MTTASLFISAFVQSFFCCTSPFGPNCTTIGVIGSLIELPADQSRTPLMPWGSWIWPVLLHLDLDVEADLFPHLDYDLAVGRLVRVVVVEQAVGDPSPL